jgi:hypothetical protein
MFDFDAGGDEDGGEPTSPAPSASRDMSALDDISLRKLDIVRFYIPK